MGRRWHGPIPPKGPGVSAARLFGQQLALILPDENRHRTFGQAYLTHVTVQKPAAASAACERDAQVKDGPGTTQILVELAFQANGGQIAKLLNQNGAGARSQIFVCCHDPKMALPRAFGKAGPVSAQV